MIYGVSPKRFYELLNKYTATADAALTKAAAQKPTAPAEMTPGHGDIEPE